MAGVVDSVQKVDTRFANLYMRTHFFKKAGDKHRGHLHKVDHVTMLTRGAVRVTFTRPDGSTDVEEFHTSPDPADKRMTLFIEIDKDTFHQFEALEDNTVYCCVFSIAGSASHAELASMQAGLCDGCVDGSGCSPLADMIAFGDGSRPPA